MALVSPEIGLIFWMTVSFLIVLFILKKFAWKPILNMLKEREDSIEHALKAADKAKEEVSKIKSDNEKILQEARLEREKILKEADELGAKILADAKKDAELQAQKIAELTKKTIQQEKENALADIKQQVVDLSVDIAEKIIKQQLSSDKSNKEYANTLLKEIDLN